MEETNLQIPVGEDGYINAILCGPTDLPDQRPRRLVIILHGQGGHCDYCYHKQLAQELATKRQTFSVRIDFRSCGSSSDGPGDDLVEKNMRTFSRDVQDVQAVYRHFFPEDSGPMNNYILSGLVGHSRGTAAMFLWTLENQEHVIVPSLVNCAGRYDYSSFQDVIDEREPGAKLNGGYYLSAKRWGKYQDVFIPYDEVVDISKNFASLERVKNLSSDTGVLSIYGLEDDVVPLQAAADYSNALQPRHRLEFIPGANHNFYGKDKKLENYNPKVVDLIIDWFSPEAERERFLRTHKYTGTINRWKDVEGVNNFRDFGGYKCVLLTSPSPLGSSGDQLAPVGGDGSVTRSDYSVVRPGILFRCASLTHITDAGAKQLQRLGIKTIFDLRSVPEVAKKPAPINLPAGIEVRHSPVFTEQDAGPQALAERYKHFFDTIEGFEKVYTDIAKSGGPTAYRDILIHLRDRPHDGIVIHCTAGKDRTGVICALILLLLGVDRDTVSREYELTTHGLKNEVQRILQAINVSDQKDQDGHFTDNAQGMKNMLSSKYEVMMGFINIFYKNFGGPHQYVKDYCGLTDDDIKIIQKNLTSHYGQGWKWIHSSL